MADYKQTTVAGTSYVRAFSVQANNPLTGTKAISFMEEKVINLGDEQITRPQGGIQEPLMTENMLEEFQLVNPVDGTPIGQTMTYQQVYLALHSLYLHVATKRDVAVAATAEQAATPAPETP